MTPEEEKRIRDLHEVTAPLHDASVSTDALITAIFGWPWTPDVQKAYAAFCQRLEVALRNNERLKDELEQAKEVIWRQYLALQIGHNDCTDYGAKEFQPSRVSNTQKSEQPRG